MNIITTITSTFDNLKSRVIEVHNKYIVNTAIVQSLKELNLSYIDQLSEINITLDRERLVTSGLVTLLRKHKILTSGYVDSRNVKYTILGNVSSKSCASIQLADGYHPAGYSFSSHEYDADTNITTWTRWDNCD